MLVLLKVCDESCCIETNHENTYNENTCVRVCIPRSAPVRSLEERASRSGVAPMARSSPRRGASAPDLCPAVRAGGYARMYASASVTFLFDSSRTESHRSITSHPTWSWRCAYLMLSSKSASTTALSAMRRWGSRLAKARPRGGRCRWGRR